MHGATPNITKSFFAIGLPPEITHGNKAVMVDINKLIEQSGKPRAQIWKEAGITSPFLSMLQSGDRRVGNPDTIRSLAEALGCTPADLRPDLAELFGTPRGSR